MYVAKGCDGTYIWGTWDKETTSPAANQNNDVRFY
jgi:hypothetical protein